MNMARLFISQDRLAAWSNEGRIELSGEIMTLSEDGRNFKLTDAVRFLRVAGNDPDPYDLIGKVKDQPTLDELGAESYVDSVILTDTAYDVQLGFVGDCVTDI